MKKYILPILIIGILGSCEKSIEDFKGFNPILPPDTKSNVSVIVSNKTYSKEDVSTIDIMGNFLDKNGERLDIDKISINGIEIEKSENGTFYNHFNYLTNKEEFPEIVNLLTGRILTLLIEDKELGTMEVSLDAPSPIKITFPEDFNGTIDLKNSFDVNWKWVKSNNTAVSNRANDNIGAAIAYHSTLANAFNSSLSDVNQALYQIEDNSSGSISFSPEQLSVLPVEGMVIIYTGTGTEVEMDGSVSGNTFSYGTYSSSGPVTISSL